MKRPLDSVPFSEEEEVFERTEARKSESSSRKVKPKVSAKAKVIQYLSRREHATEELRQKLSVAGYEEPDIQAALEWATKHSYQSDERFAVSLHRRRASTYGNRAIESELTQLGLKGVLQNLDSDPQSAEILPESERAYDWLQRRYASQLMALFTSEEGTSQSELFKLKAKAWQALTRRGFEIRNIDTAWRRLTVELNSDR